jgi:hypothetical protein
VAGQQTIDWSFFGMVRYLLTADSADDSVIPGSAWDGFPERLAEAGLLVAGSQLPEAAVDRASACRGLLDAALPDGTARVTPAQRRRGLDERLRQVTRLQRS